MGAMSNVLATIINENKGIDRLIYLFKSVKWQFSKRLGHSFLYKLDNGAAVQVHPSTAYSGIFYARNPEGDDMLFLRKHAHLAETFVDVGANVGLFSASIFDCFRKVICFEPAPSSFRALSETCALNPQVECELNNIGVGAEPGELHFEDRFDYSTTSRFVPEAGDNTIKVAVDTLDRVLGETGKPLVMKIDVEGFEEQVFAGADRLFASKRVKLLMFERLGRTNLENVCGFLEARGYSAFRAVQSKQITGGISKTQANWQKIINTKEKEHIINLLLYKQLSKNGYNVQKKACTFKNCFIVLLLQLVVLYEDIKIKLKVGFVKTGYYKSLRKLFSKRSIYT